MMDNFNIADVLSEEEDVNANFLYNSSEQGQEDIMQTLQDENYLGFEPNLKAQEDMARSIQLKFSDESDDQEEVDTTKENLAKPPPNNYQFPVYEVKSLVFDTVQKFFENFNPDRKYKALSVDECFYWMIVACRNTKITIENFDRREVLIYSARKECFDFFLNLL